MDAAREVEQQMDPIKGSRACCLSRRAVDALRKQIVGGRWGQETSGSNHGLVGGSEDGEEGARKGPAATRVVRSVMERERTERVTYGEAIKKGQN